LRNDPRINISSSIYADTMSSPETPEEPPPAKKRNAFSELMSPKPKQAKPTAADAAAAAASNAAPPTPNNDGAKYARYSSNRRDGLLAYIENPTSFAPSHVIQHTPAFVAIHDLYPKATIHLLLLPRDPAKYLQHPFVALSDPTFLASVRQEAGRLKALAASELRRRFGPTSAADAPYLAALDADPPAATLPAGRDWAAEVMVGVHAHPSMNHLHVHVISRDRHSETLRHRKHYNSFSTPFFVPLAEFPLADDDPRRHPGREGYLKRNFVCWRCGKEFGNRFSRLKEHLEEEFEAWKRE
jgi:aprataxin